MKHQIDHHFTEPTRNHHNKWLDVGIIFYGQHRRDLKAVAVLDISGLRRRALLAVQVGRCGTAGAVGVEDPERASEW